MVQENNIIRQNYLPKLIYSFGTMQHRYFIEFLLIIFIIKIVHLFWGNSSLSFSYFLLCFCIYSCVNIYTYTHTYIIVLFFFFNTYGLFLYVYSSNYFIQLSSITWISFYVNTYGSTLYIFKLLKWKFIMQTKECRNHSSFMSLSNHKSPKVNTIVTLSKLLNVTHL